MFMWLSEVSVLESHWPVGLDAAQASSRTCRPAFDSRIHFTSLEAATSEPMVRIAELMRSRDLDATRRAIEHFTQQGTLSEFHQLNFYGLVEGLEASNRLEEIARRKTACNETDNAELEREAAEHLDAAAAFLDGALDIASTDHERVVAQENRASFSLMRGQAHAAVVALVAALRIEQTETLWANLLIALERVGAMTDVDRVLDVLAGSCTARLLRVITEDDHDFDNLRQRPAYQRFLAKATARVHGASC